MASSSDLGSLKFVIRKAVPGTQAKDVFGKMDVENRRVFAAEIGTVIRAFHKINSTGFERNYGPWKKYLSGRLQEQKSIHIQKGNTPEWAEKN